MFIDIRIYIYTVTTLYIYMTLKNWKQQQTMTMDRHPSCPSAELQVFFSWRLVAKPDM